MTVVMIGLQGQTVHFTYEGQRVCVQDQERREYVTVNRAEKLMTLLKRHGYMPWERKRVVCRG
jgi:hypothetical protein